MGIAQINRQAKYKPEEYTDLEMPVPNELEDGRWRKCEYREAARQLLKGENVTI